MNSTMQAILQSLRIGIYIPTLHIPNRIFQSPIPHLVEVPALVIRLQFWPGQWVSVHHVEGKDANVCVALNFLPEHLEAVIYIC